jgi:hypothetical protein
VLQETPTSKTPCIIKRFHKIKNNSKEYEIFSIKIQEVGNRRENVGRWFQEENDDVLEHYREYADVGGRDLGMEGTRGGERV